MPISNIFGDNKRFRVIFALFIIVIFLLRVPLITKGHMHFPDELRYRLAFTAIDNFKEGKVKEALAEIFKAFSRPSYVVFSMIPASIQRIFDPQVGTQDVEYDRLNTYAIASAFNLIASILIIILLYLFIFHLTKDRFFSFAGTFVYSFLNISYFDIRHELPYYIGMLIMFAVIYQAICEKEGEFAYPKVVYYGIISGIGFTYYPGYYFLNFALLAIILSVNKQKIKTLLIHALAFMAVLLFYELISIYADQSYLFHKVQLKCAYDALPTDPAKPFDFAWILTYNAGIEGLAGLGILGFFFAYLARGLKNAEKKVKFMYLAMIAVYVFIVAMIYLKGKFTIRVKYLYPFIFLEVIGAFIFLRSIGKKGQIAAGVLMVVTVSQFAYFYTEYTKAVYPRDLREYVRYEHPDKKFINTAEYYPKRMQDTVIAIAVREGFDFLGVNLSNYTNALGEGHPIIIKDKETLFSYSHPETTYKPYSGDVYRFWDKVEKYPMRVYKLK